MGGMIYIPSMIVMSSHSVIGLVSFPDQRKKVGLGSCLCQSCSAARFLQQCNYLLYVMYIRGAAQIGDRVNGW